MYQLTAQQNRILEKACDKILKEPDISFCGVINTLGNLIVGGFREGITPCEGDEKMRMMYMQLVLEAKMRREYDEALGKLDYIASRRAKVLMVTVPIYDKLVLVSASPDSDAKEISEMVYQEFKTCNVGAHA